MSSDEEVERFEVTDRDLRDAFYPGSRRKFTKEQAIYGMWADDDERGSSRSGGRRKTDLTSGLEFVSGGFTQEQQEEDDEEDERSDIDQGEGKNLDFF